MTAPIVWSDPARALFALSGPTAVSAGAGSGKTTCLVELCLRLLSGEATGVPCEPRDLVAITFTEKAGAELEERLRDAVAGRAAATPAGSDEARAWRGRGHALDAMAIGTIHGFARRVLREHALAAGLDPEFEVLDEDLAAVWRRDSATAAVLAALDAADPGAQLLVAAHGAAGAERGVAAVVAGLVRERATLGRVRPLAPGADATAEALAARTRLLAAADALLGEAAGVATASGRRALERMREALSALDPGQRTGPLGPATLTRLAALAGALGGWRAGKSDAARAVALKEEIGPLCEEFLAIAAEALAAPQRRALCGLVADAERRFRDRKREARVLDFDDLLVATRDLLRRPDGPRDELRRGVRALLVDEYQDVNQVQQEIFERIADPRDPSGPILVAVGDAKQSIYRFRGADVSVFRGLLDRFDGAGRGRVLHLAVNHRSTAPVLDLVNEVSARAMQPGPGEPQPYELAFRDEDRLAAARTDGVAPACEILEDGAEGPAAERRAREATAIAARIGALVSGAAGVGIAARGPGPASFRTPRYADVAILFRRLTQLADYERALRAAGIPYRVARGGGFYQAPEVRDLGELAALLADGDDALAWAAALRSPFCAVGDGALLTLARRGWPALVRGTPDQAAAAVLEADPSARAEAERLRAFLEVHAELRGLRARVPASRLIAIAVERLDVEAVHRASPDGARRAANLRKALAVADRLAARGATLADVARRLRLLARLPPREPEADLDGGDDSVSLLSIHQAKGLEWPVVFVPDLGSLPPREAGRALLDGEALAVAWYDPESGAHRPTRALLRARRERGREAAAESPRLLYVALTRARDRLVLSGEAGRGGDCWRAMIERALGDRPGLAIRIPLAQAGTYACGGRDAPVRAERGPAEQGGVEVPLVDRDPRALLDPARLAGPRPASVRIAVTRLAEHARCPRRLALRDAGVAERGPGAGATQDDPGRATARGTLAHALVAEIDLAAPPPERRGQMAAVASRRGYDPASPGVRRILADVARFLDSAGGRALSGAARGGRLRREVPFLLRVGDDAPPACYLDGAIDALIEEDHGQIAVIDFKYALPAPGAVERYRFQLLAYAAAAGRATGRGVAARLQFLRGDHRAVDVTPSDREIRAFLRDAARLARAAAEGAGGAAMPVELGRTAERCRAERCGFVDRCWR